MRVFIMQVQYSIKLQYPCLASFQLKQRVTILPPQMCISHADDIQKWFAVVLLFSDPGELAHKLPQETRILLAFVPYDLLHSASLSMMCAWGVHG